MTHPESLAFRQLAAAELHLAVDWARQEGWNPGIHDAASFLAADPDGFFTSLHDNEPAAIISVVNHGPDFAFLGFYICRPELRGNGYGLAVWNHALQHAGNRTIGLDGVIAQQDNYVKSGFTLAWRNIRFQGNGGGATGDGIVDLDTVPFDQIAALDAHVFEGERRDFLRNWIAQPGAIRLGVLQDGELTGWGLLRPCVVGWKIGPLYANDPVTGEMLLDGLLAAVPGESVLFDVPEPNTIAVHAARARGMTPVFETARMYRGQAPVIDINRVWGVTTFEVG